MRTLVAAAEPEPRWSTVSTGVTAGSSVTVTLRVMVPPFPVQHLVPYRTTALVGEPVREIGAGMEGN